MALMYKSVLRGEVSLLPRMKSKWLVDSALTSHICINEKKFERLKNLPRRPVEVGDGQLVDIHGIGIVRGTLFVKHCSWNICDRWQEKAGDDESCPVCTKDDLPSNFRKQDATFWLQDNF